MAVFRVDWDRIFKLYQSNTIQVKVMPEVLVTQAEEVRRLGNNMKKRFQEIENVIGNTKGYWMSDAGELHRKLYENQKENINQILERLLEHPDDLLLISGNYKVAEQKNVESAAMLNADIIL